MYYPANDNNNDRLDAARDKLVALAIDATPDPMDAIATLLTAGFHILTETVGPHHAVGTMRNIMETMAARIAN